MLIWRLARRQHADLDGEGARLYGGRWSSEGLAVIYAASHLSLSALEYLVHIDVIDIPADLTALAIEVPDDADEVTLGPDDLPAGWRDTPAPPGCASIGDHWIAENEALLLRVPSVIVPEESNVLLNPAHPMAREVRIARTRGFVYDPRLFQR